MTGPSPAVDPPVARREPAVLTSGDRTRVDDYAWMSDDEAGLLGYLQAERQRYDAATAPTAALQADVYEEMAARVSESDESVAWRHGRFRYNTRQRAGQQYPVFCRIPPDDEGTSTAILDLNLLAAGADYLALGARELNPDGSLLAYSVDTAGDETFTLRVRDLASGNDRPDVVPGTDYGCAWSADSMAFLYVVADAAHRPYRVMRHELGHPSAEDTVVFEEADERFHIEINASRSGEVVVISSQSTTTSEVRLLPTADLASVPRVVAPRRPGVQYTVEHSAGEDGGSLYIVTNDDAVEFRLMSARLHAGSAAEWSEVLKEDPAERLVAVDAFRRLVGPVLPSRRLPVGPHDGSRDRSDPRPRAPSCRPPP